MNENAFNHYIDKIDNYMIYSIEKAYIVNKTLNKFNYYSNKLFSLNKCKE
jgi:hypothetical protein